MNKLLLCLAMLWSINASAFIDPPVFSPQPILANQPITVSIRRGDCDLFPFVGHPVDVVQVPPNRIQLYVSGSHQTNPILCSPTIVGTVQFTLPPLSAGEYQFELYVRVPSNPVFPIHNGPVASFTVVESVGLTPVPGLNLWGMAGLLIGMVGAAVFGMRTK